MRKEVLFVVVMLLVNFMFVSAEWVGTETEFVSGDVDYEENLVDDSGNYLFLIGLIVLVLILGIVYFRKVNKGKVSRKRMVKKK
jgi:LPXTG-motif cell wall-anchored protein